MGWVFVELRSRCRCLTHKSPPSVPFGVPCGASGIKEAEATSSQRCSGRLAGGSNERGIMFLRAEMPEFHRMMQQKREKLVAAAEHW